MRKDASPLFFSFLFIFLLLKNRFFPNRRYFFIKILNKKKKENVGLLS